MQHGLGCVHYGYLLAMASQFIQTGTLQDFQSDVLDALQNRTDVTAATIANYAAKTIRELSESYPFEELRVTGPTFQLTIGQVTYPITSFLGQNGPATSPQDIYSMPESFAIYVDFPNNTVTAPVRYKTPAGIETILAPATQGIPAWYTRFGQNFMVAPNPQQPYSMFLRYQAKHPFTTTSPTSLTEQVFMPLSWYDIIAYATAERIAIVKRWNDQAKYLHDLLWGDPEYQSSGGKRGRPGLVAARTFQQERDEAYNSRSLMPVIGRTNPR